MKLETRLFVLEKSLLLEETISQIVKLFLAFNVPNSRSVNNKSDGLSFQNKIDLLYDTSIISAPTWNNLQLVMQFRNQFVHNHECNTFTDAISIVDAGIKNKLLQFIQDTKVKASEKYTEQNLKMAFTFLHKSITQEIEIILANNTKAIRK